ncbi:conserved hypothetical protein [Parafrankia sp. EUN1f]|nr:conserved hypothetical protein [Parafrankia sp. EUN1f]
MTCWAQRQSSPSPVAPMTAWSSRRRCAVAQGVTGVGERVVRGPGRRAPRCRWTRGAPRRRASLPGRADGARSTANTRRWRRSESSDSRRRPGTRSRRREPRPLPTAGRRPSTAGSSTGWTRVRPFRAGRRPGARRTPSRPTSLRVHQGVVARGPGRDHRAQRQARIDPARGGSELAAIGAGGDRPLPGPLAPARRRPGGGMVDLRRVQGAGPRPAHRRLQPQRGPAPTDSADRARRDRSAAAFAPRPRRRGRRASLRTGRGDRRHRLRSHGPRVFCPAP